MPIVSHLSEGEQKFHLANHKLPIIIEATNKLIDANWKANFYGNQKNWYPWTYQTEDKEQPSGVGLSLRGVGYARTVTDCGARFAYCSEEAAEAGYYANRQLYIDKELNN